ncbi:MAG: Bifunctional protein PyrR [Bacteroidetes bacterium MED-G17]|nr:MAG: Bifunctional protein PyrR [Bacteroidetes bacterium MED-G17]|tara:strand:+ start:1688 stop:2215 length:528 start_codon:yes stop_codon:yes gene_type:complete
MIKTREIIQSKKVNLLLHRLAYQLYENYGDFSNTALISLQPRGINFGKVLLATVEEITKTPIEYGELDITLFRDDFGRNKSPLIPSKTNIDFQIEDKKIVIIDDVLYTGRSIRAAMEAINNMGRPQKIELLVLIDRRFNREIPIQPDYVGEEVDTRANDKVKVDMKKPNVIIETI